MTKIVKRVKDYSDRERLEKLGLTKKEKWSKWNFQIDGLVSFFNGISTFVGYLMPKPFS